jgi:phosphonopyruvate decarboxylase
MISPIFFIELLRKNNVGFYSGVPDSLLKGLCACITDNFDANSHIIAANEGAAVGLAAGYHLATGKIPVVYMQNSGIGKAVNPLLYLMDN